jgi:phenylpyruvate tautomerase PptA (4-oxalocrotonate tautomerase family)
MPIYTRTTSESTLESDTKASLAREVGRIHAAINLVPSTYVNVVFHELAKDNVYTDGAPAGPVLRPGSPTTDQITARMVTPPPARVRGCRVGTGCRTSLDAAARLLLG